MQWSAQLRRLTLSWHSCCLLILLSMNNFYGNHRRKEIDTLWLNTKYAFREAIGNRVRNSPSFNWHFSRRRLIMCWLSRWISFYFVFNTKFFFIWLCNVLSNAISMSWHFVWHVSNSPFFLLQIIKLSREESSTAKSV